MRWFLFMSLIVALLFGGVPLAVASGEHLYGNGSGYYGNDFDYSGNGSGYSGNSSVNGGNGSGYNNASSGGYNSNFADGGQINMIDREGVCNTDKGCVLNIWFR